MRTFCNDEGRVRETWNQTNIIPPCTFIQLISTQWVLWILLKMITDLSGCDMAAFHFCHILSSMKLQLNLLVWFLESIVCRRKLLPVWLRNFLSRRRNKRRRWFFSSSSFLLAWLWAIGSLTPPPPPLTEAWFFLFFFPWFFWSFDGKLFSVASLSLAGCLDTWFSISSFVLIKVLCNCHCVQVQPRAFDWPASQSQEMKGEFVHSPPLFVTWPVDWCALIQRDGFWLAESPAV